MTNLGAGVVPTADRESFVPRQFAAETELGEVGVTLEMEIAVNERLQATCTALRVQAGEGGQVTGDLLRQVPLARLLREAVATAASMFKFQRRLPGGGARFELFPGGDAAADIYERAKAPRRGLPLTDDELREVADIYREAVARGDRSPTRAVGEAKHAARSTAARWVGKARKKGFLGPAMPGRAGEREETS